MAEAQQFLQAISGDRLHALYELALRTGLRKGKLLGLHWEDLDPRWWPGPPSSAAAPAA
ncbi:hypothetical protein ACIRPS_28040 [Streptomyces griseoviridis]